jgi:hypothetical protein
MGLSVGADRIKHIEAVADGRLLHLCFTFKSTVPKPLPCQIWFQLRNWFQLIRRARIGHDHRSGFGLYKANGDPLDDEEFIYSIYDYVQAAMSIISQRKTSA